MAGKSPMGHQLPADLPGTCFPAERELPKIFKRNPFKIKGINDNTCFLLSFSIFWGVAIM